MMVVQEVVKSSHSLLKVVFLMLVFEFEMGLGLERPYSICFAICVYSSKGHLVVVLFCLVCGLEITGASGVDKLEILS